MKEKSIEKCALARLGRRVCNGIGIVLLAASCQQNGFPELNEETAPVVLTIQQFEQIPFDDAFNAQTKAGVNEICTRLHFVLFKDGSKEEMITQIVGDEGFGTLSKNLCVGTHQLVVIAHNGDANASITTPEKVEFSSNKSTTRVTDTFYYYGEIEVRKDGTNRFSISLKRAVAKFRLNLSGAIPDNVTKLVFAYSGGSMSLNPQTGTGAAKSNQTEELAVLPDKTVYEVYTFPRSDSQALKMTITAFDEFGNNLKETLFEEVPIARNRITVYQGDLFAGGVNSYTTGDFGITVEDEWTISETFQF